MPELPEIETIKRVLEPQIQGAVCQRVTVGRPEIIAHPSAGEFSSLVMGQEISSMGRRGKFLTIHLKNSSRIILHLRMTGSLLVTPRDFPVEKHTHLTIGLEDGRELRFSDIRRFGRVWLVQSGEEDVYSGIAKLGPEPFDETCNGEYLERKLCRSRRPVKECLLDQGVIAGIGNIYSDEILFRARLHPSRPANSLTPDEWARLAEVIPACLSFFIEKNATTPEEYLKSGGKDYRNTPFLQVYGHGGEQCPVCGEILCRKVIDGRGSVYCPGCQKEG